MGKKLFPEYLNNGSKGPAVAILQIILKAGGCDPHNQIIVDGEYGFMTRLAVEHLQDVLGVEKDGNFCPYTREALSQQWGLDVNILPADLFVGETAAVSPS